MLSRCLVAPPSGWSSQKPPPGVPIDRRHPLTQGLIFFAALNEAAGPLITDSVSGKLGTIKNAGTTRVWSKKPGWLFFDGVDDRLDFPNIAPVLPGRPYTFAAMVIDGLSGSHMTQFYICVMRAADAGPALYVGNSLNSPCFAWTKSSGNNLSVIVDAQCGMGWQVPKCVVVTIDGSGLAAGVHMYFDGREYSYQTRMNGGVLYSGLGSWCLGGRIGSDTYSLGGVIAWAAAWQRVLAIDDIWRLGAQPYCLFEASVPITAVPDRHGGG
jgi:hypothetical protein